MVKSGVIVSHPKSKPSPAKGVTRHQQRIASGHYVKRDAHKGSFVLPPGPPNTIVRTPYPIAPKDGDLSD